MTYKFAIDAGHGYDTPGKRCPDGSMREWEFNHVVANYVAAELANYEDVETIFTHDTTPNRDVPLPERTNKANAYKATAFISIHANAMSGQWGTARGIETYIYTTRPKTSVDLANAVHAELIARTGRLNRGVKAENFHVLRETNMTAILVECGFMDNREEAELLKSDDYRRICAAAIVAGIVKNYGLNRKPEPKPEPAPAPQPEAHAPEIGRKADMKRWIEELGRKGLIEDVNGWKVKVDAGITTEDLAYLTLALVNRISK